MGKTITQYQADDGAIFATEVEMRAHEASLDLVRIDAWVASVPDWARGEEACARRLVAAFMAFERGEPKPWTLYPRSGPVETAEPPVDAQD